MSDPPASVSIEGSQCRTNIAAPAARTGADVDPGAAAHITRDSKGHTVTTPHTSTNNKRPSRATQKKRRARIREQEAATDKLVADRIRQMSPEERAERHMLATYKPHPNLLGPGPLPRVLGSDEAAAGGEIRRDRDVQG